MPNTPGAGLSYPALSDVPNVPSDMQALATDLDSQVVPRFATAVARDAAITSPVEGQLCYLSAAGVKELQKYDGAAWRGMGERPLFAYKSTDESLSGTITLQNDDNLFLALPANSTWKVEVGLYTRTPATADFQWTFTIPSGATGIYAYDRYVSGAWLGGAATNWTATAASDGSDSTDLWQLMNGVLVVTTAGTLQLKWAENGPASGTMIVRAGSYLMATRVV